MGGYSEQCKFCPKWFTNSRAIKDHVKSKHPNDYRNWLLMKGWITVKYLLRNQRP